MSSDTNEPGSPVKGQAAGPVPGAVRRPVGRPRKNPLPDDAAKPSARRPKNAAARTAGAGGRVPGKPGRPAKKANAPRKAGATAGTVRKTAGRKPAARRAGANDELIASIPYGEGTGRGSAKQTRKRILAAARILFARNGMDGVSVRAIAEAAGINHALVHRYFGSKMDMICEIVQNEISAFGQASLPQPSENFADDLEKIREIIRQVLVDMRTTTLLILRAEMDGLNPVRLLQETTPRGTGNLAEWIAIQQGKLPESARAALPDARATAMVVSGAIYALVAAEPWMASAVGLLAEPADDRRERLLDTLVHMLALAVGRQLP